MPTVKIQGRIWPMHNLISVGSLPSLSWADNDMAVPTQFTAIIDKSAITVECVVDSYDPANSSLLLIRAFQYVRGIVDCLAFSWGLGLTVMFDSLVDPMGENRHVEFANPNLSALATTFPLSSSSSPHVFLEMYQVVLNDPELFLAMNDLILAISVPGHVAVSCARAVEGLRAMIIPSDETRLRAWEIFRHVLNIERSYIDYITTASVSGRHGSKYNIPQDNGIILERSWVIMNRFLAFRKGNNMPLPIDRYPLLS
jgi:hypothetical protein